MDFDDSITISVPEGGDIELRLAGLASRCIAGAFDVIIQLLLLLALALLTGALSGGSRLDVVVFIVGGFLVWFGYPIAFEVLARGRTPGKRLSHLRVVREHGEAVDLPASAIRNLIRIIDGPTLLYVPTAVSILLTRNNQRPGDLAADTLVIRETPVANTAPAPIVPRAQPAAAGGAPNWDVSAVSVAEIAAVRGFLARRETLAPDARRELGLRLADGLWSKVAGAARTGGAEEFLETLVRLRDGG